MYILKFVGDIAWISRNLKNLEDSIFGPKPSRHINLDSSDFDVVDTNDNTHKNFIRRKCKVEQKKNVLN